MDSITYMLQVNQRGAWRNVLEFDAAQRGEIEAAVVPLCKVTRATFAIRDATGSRIRICEPASFGWRATQWARAVRSES